MKNLIERTTTSLFYLIFVSSIISGVFRGFDFTTLSFLIWFLVALGILKAMDALKINKDYKLLVLLSIWLNLIGVVYFYNNFQYYDKILHFVISFMITMIVYDYFLKNMRKIPEKFPVLSASLGLLAMWEIVEYLLDTFFGFGFLGVYNSAGQLILSPIIDTMIDLILGVLGAIGYLIFKKGKVL